MIVAASPAVALLHEAPNLNSLSEKRLIENLSSRCRSFEQQSKKSSNDLYQNKKIEQCARRPEKAAITEHLVSEESEKPVNATSKLWSIDNEDINDTLTEPVETTLETLDHLEAQDETFQRTKQPKALFIRYMPNPLRSWLISRIGLEPIPEITRLSTSFSVHETIDALQKHTWQLEDITYVVLTIFCLFSLCIITEPGPLVKFAIFNAYIMALVFPATRQFALPFFFIFSWLVLYYSSRFIPVSWRPPISVRVLPALENIIYGANLSSILAKQTNSVLDVLAWLPYGIVHFAGPFIIAAVLFLFSPPGTLPVYARCFGILNMLGVIIQILFPCSPPWYEQQFGLMEANYGMHGSPGGLARIDFLLNIHTYTKGFTSSPLVFGAFPSLHSGCATMEVLFLAYRFPQFQAVFWGYLLWLWWSTMYLTHHYFVDLIGGSILAVTVYYCIAPNKLPLIHPGKILRWEYDYTIKYNIIQGRSASNSLPCYGNSNISNIPNNANNSYMPISGSEVELQQLQH